MPPLMLNGKMDELEVNLAKISTLIKIQIDSHCYMLIVKGHLSLIQRTINHQQLTYISYCSN